MIDDKVDNKVRGGYNNSEINRSIEKLAKFLISDHFLYFEIEL